MKSTASPLIRLPNGFSASRARRSCRRAIGSAELGRVGMTVWRVLRYWLYIGHRWLGIGVCLLFVLWFVSGLVMSYVGYPEAQPARRYQALQLLDWKQVRLDPDGLLAYLSLQRYPRELRLEMLLGRPVYRVIDWDGSRTTVSAHSGER